VIDKRAITVDVQTLIDAWLVKAELEAVIDVDSLEKLSSLIEIAIEKAYHSGYELAKTSTHRFTIGDATVEINFAAHIPRHEVERALRELTKGDEK
jgi:hypothetical protein